VLAICDRFHCLPSQVLAEPASILRLLKIEALGTPPQEQSPRYEDPW
jgi:hypothetical protein